MHSFDTVSQAIDSLRQQGYTEDFNLTDNCLVCNRGRYNLSDSDFMVDKFYRFEGNSDPADESIVYAISSDKYPVKGVLIDAFGPYSTTVVDDILKMLTFRP